MSQPGHEAPKKSSLRSTLLSPHVVLSAVLSLILIAGIATIAFQEPPKRAKPRKVVAQRPHGKFEKKVEAVVEAKKDTTRSLADRMRTDILNVAPEIYHTVTLTMMEKGGGGGNTNVKSVKSLSVPVPGTTSRDQTA